MPRNPIAASRSKALPYGGRDLGPWLRVALAAATWAATVGIVQVAAQGDIGRTARQLEERIELQLRLMERVHVPLPEPRPPERSHEEAIDPWELVSV